MYYYLKEYCALIISSIALHDGLSSNVGMVAVYGNGPLAYSLHQVGTKKSIHAIDFMLRKESNIPIQMQQFSYGPISMSVCVPQNIGVKGLVDYLKGRGFRESEHLGEIKDAKRYILEATKYKSLISKIKNSNHNFKFIPEFGRELTAAISIGKLKITGPYQCLSGIQNQARYSVAVETPISMGILTLKSKIELLNVSLGLVYINGNLRIISSTETLVVPFNRPIWDIYPSLDINERFGILDRMILDTFFYSYYSQSPENVFNNRQEQIYLGCPKNIPKIY